jgi:hypothetical protein
MDGKAKELTHTGLVYSEVDEINVDVEKAEPLGKDDTRERYDTDVSGGDVTIMPTSAGNTVFKILGAKEKARLDKRRKERKALIIGIELQKKQRYQ